jgi:bis(5'-adenosyl)-triphosphatase
MNNSTNIPINNCSFCRKEIFEKSFCTTSRFSAFYNIAPILPGHSLIIPNKHYESLFELSDEELSEMMVFARKITSVLKTVFNSDGFDWTIQDGISAGQTVPHLHLHIIPRVTKDLRDGDEWYNHISENESILKDNMSRKVLKSKEYDKITKQLYRACNK